jgi:hypothetical protein
VLREEIACLRAEVERLHKLVACNRAEHQFEGRRSNEATANVLRQAAASADVWASDRFNKAACYVVNTAFNRADLDREWDRTERAIGDLLSCPSKQVNFELPRARAHQAGANRLRLARQVVQPEKERIVIRKCGRDLGRGGLSAR